MEKKDSQKKQSLQVSPRSSSSISLARQTSIRSVSSSSSYDSILNRNHILERQNELLSSKCNLLIDILHNIPSMISKIDFFKYTHDPSPKDIIDTILLKIEYFVHIQSLKCLDPEICNILQQNNSTGDVTSLIQDSSSRPHILLLQGTWDDHKD